MTNTDAARLSLDETEIVICAVRMLRDWSWTKNGEPLGVLTYACKKTFGCVRHDQLSRIHQAERAFAPAGALSNNVEVRLRALEAVLKFRGTLTV